MYHEVPWKRQVRRINGRPSLQQLRNGAGFLLSSSSAAGRQEALAVAGGEGLTAAERRLPGFPGDLCLHRRAKAKQKLEKEKGTGMWGLDEAALAVAWSVGREGTVKATELSPSLPRSLHQERGRALSLPGSATMRLVTVRRQAWSREGRLIMQCEQPCAECVPLSMSPLGDQGDIPRPWLR